MIRDGSDNARSLDDVMRTLYHDAYKAGKGFTGDEWWKAVQSAAGGKSFAEFDARYVDGRDPYPWASVLLLAAMQLVADSTRVPVLGVTMGEIQGGGPRVMSIAPGSTAEVAGVQPGDQLLSVGDIPGDAPGLAEHLQARYGSETKVMIPITVNRGGRQLSLVAPLDYTWRVQRRIEPLAGASAKAVRIRSGILHGTTG